MSKKWLIIISIAVIIMGAAIGFIGSGGFSYLYVPKGETEIRLSGKPSSQVTADVKRATSGFNELMQENQAKLTRRVILYIAEGDAAYEQVLTTEFNEDSSAARDIVKISGGWSGGKIAVTALNAKAGVMANKSDRYMTTAHELYHQMQYELAGGNNSGENSIFWLEEGSADYVGAKLAEKLGGKKFNKWVLDTELTLLGATDMADISKLGVNNLTQRKDIMRTYTHAYQQSDIMCYFLLEQYAKGNELAKLNEYFSALKNNDAAAAFTKTFGVSLKDFLIKFKEWQVAEQQKFQLDITAREGVAAATKNNIARELSKTKNMLLLRFGINMAGKYEIVLTKNSEDLANALIEICSMDKKEANDIAKASLWIENGSTVFINTGELKDNNQVIFTAGSMLMRMYQTQRLDDSKPSIEWLTRGTGYIAGVTALMDSGEGSLNNYLANWQQNLRQRPLPNLADMRTKENFNQIANAYSDDTVAMLSEVAVAELLMESGYAGIVNWQEMVRQNMSVDKAFSAAFGKNLSAFENKINMMLYR